MQLRVLKDVRRRSGIFCYSIVKNQIWLLPHFLRHYRALGFGWFVFYDDGSTDGTRELLLEQEDCVVLAAPAGEDQSTRHWGKLQRALSNRIPEHFGAGGWSVTADSDEFLLLPSRFSTIGELTSYLDDRGLDCVLAPMVDFYPERLAARNFGDVSPFEGAPWFDRDLGFLRAYPQVRPPLVAAGVRVRMLRMLMERDPERARQITRGKRNAHAWLVKVPLLKTGRGLMRADPHFLNRAAPMGVQIALAHFKFHPGTDANLEMMVEVNWANNFEYVFLKEMLDRFGEESLISDRSVRYTGPQDLEAHSMIWAD